MTKFSKYMYISTLFIFLLTFDAIAANGLRLIGHLDNKHGTTQGVSYSGSWGYVAPDGREYAIVGTATGTAIIEITDTLNIHEIAHITGPTSVWREMRTYKDRLYIVSEGGLGTQIVDLSSLPAGVHLIKNYTYTSGTKNTIRSHTIEIFDGYMYLNGCANWSPGGVLIFSLADRDNPQFVGQYQPQYIHDCYVRHDTLYGASIYNGGGLDIASVVNKAAPVHINKIAYSGSGTHNVWTTTDGKYAITTDEIGNTPKTLKFWNLQSLPSVPAAPTATYQFSPLDIEHNVFVRGNYAYTAWYSAGIVVVDIHNPASPLTAGFYDTSNDTLYPPPNYEGVWAVYPYFWSGKVTAGDEQNGLYVFTHDSLKARTPVSLLNPADQAVMCGNSPITFQWTRAANPQQDPHNYLLGLKGPGIDTTFTLASDTSFTMPNISLLPGTFTWYVITKDEANQVSSQDTFSFVRPAPVITAPNGGETVKIFSQATISWNWVCPDSLEISYSTDNGSTWTVIAPRVASSPNSYSWNVPIVPTTQGRIRLRDIIDTNRADISDNAFTIFNSASLTVTSPNGGEVWQSGVAHPIIWSYTSVGNIRIEYTIDNGANWVTLAADTPAAIGSYNWTTPSLSTGYALVRLTELTNPTITDISNATFAITPVSYNVASLWNLLSIPVVPYNRFAAVNFPGAQSFVFKYTGSYLKSDSIDNGIGYWVKFDTARTMYGVGTPVALDTIPLNPQWNMIGSLTQSAAVGSIVVLPNTNLLSNFFGYSDGFGYTVADTIFPGKGYWVKASEAGSIILSSSPLNSPSAHPHRDDLSSLNTLTFEDAGHHTQKLYFGNHFDAAKEDVALPPLPPAGAFDIRFSSQQFAQQINEQTSAGIDLQAVSYPLHITTSIKDGMKYHLIEKQENNNTAYDLSSSYVVVSSNQSGKLFLVPAFDAEIPATFSLHQNYPNPFNPTTIIRYELPGEARVSLKVFNLLGQELTILVDAIQDAGFKSVQFDATGLPTGIYYYKLIAASTDGKQNANFTAIRKMVIAK